MGVPFRILCYASSQAHGEEAAQAVMARIAHLNTLLSDYEEDSELTQLNRTAGSGRPVKVSPELWQVLREAQRMARLSAGAFDITAGPYISLWRRARRIHRLPEPEKLAEAQKAVGYQKLRLDPPKRTATLLVPRMKLDLGGLAKGFAADEALKVFRRYGITRALVAASGDTSVADAPPAQKGWQVEIGLHPDAPPTTSPRRLLLRHHSVATSGDAQQAVVLEGRRYSHIVNPFTGLGLTDQSQVTVIHPQGMVADALATAISVLGPLRGLELAESQGAALLYQRKLADRLDEIVSRRFGRFLLQ
ncbi:MAG: FAD:protein FMN transferase [Verrucomicrobiae bacterium]|nr:FAD:protein FMN transferase [Verrucomicrobiae bacterium]